MAYDRHFASSMSSNSSSLSWLTRCLYLFLYLAVACAGTSSATAAALAPGAVVGWGINNDNEAILPPGTTGVTAIAAGGYHSLVLKKDGTVVEWGYKLPGATPSRAT
jgi:alpha-tubulin suppressor-like RCC1 family protein